MVNTNSISCYYLCLLWASLRQRLSNCSFQSSPNAQPLTAATAFYYLKFFLYLVQYPFLISYDMIFACFLIASKVCVVHIHYLNKVRTIHSASADTYIVTVPVAEVR